jgi:hypothetical protein
MICKSKPRGAQESLPSHETIIGTPNALFTSCSPWSSFRVFLLRDLPRATACARRSPDGDAVALDEPLLEQAEANAIDTLNLMVFGRVLAMPNC